GYTATLAMRLFVTSFQAGQASAFENLFFFLAGDVVDLGDVLVGQVLDPLVGGLDIVLGDVAVLLRRLDHVVAVAPGAAHRDARVLGHLFDLLDQIFAALLGERRDRQPNQLGVGDR